MLITTTYLPNSGRIKAQTEHGSGSIMIPRDFSNRQFDDHVSAARKLIREMGYDITELVCHSTKTGYVFMDVIDRIKV